MKLPTLETGISTRRLSSREGCRSTSSGHRRCLQRGFTLWELLIVVAIVAITLSMMQFSMGLGDESRDLKRVGKDLGKLFHLLNQEAVFENRNYAISVQENGYMVLEYDSGEWSQVDESFFTRFKMTESQSSELIIEDLIVDITPQTELKPHILILSSGEMTPFEWNIRDQRSQSRIVLQGNLIGGVLMTGPEPLG